MSENYDNRPRGDWHPGAKISERMARELRRNWGRLSMQQRYAFAEAIGVSMVHLRDVASGRSWKWLDEPVVYNPKTDDGRKRPKRDG